MKWAFGRFSPLSTTLLEEKLDTEVDRNQAELKEMLSRYWLSEDKTQKTEVALDQLLFFTSVYFDDTE